MSDSDWFASRPWLWRSAVALLIVVGIGRIVAAYSQSWQTWDEPPHMAAGMEWLDRGEYRYEVFHPPLARVAGATGPYLGGDRSVGMKSMWDEGNAILAASEDYERTLTFARLGVLPFFLAACLVVAFWGQATFGRATGLFGVLLLTTTPTFLGHSGVATLDIPCAAMTAMALFAWSLWLGEPSRPRSWFLGCAAALAILCKFSAIGFLVIAGLALVALYWFVKPGVSTENMAPSRWRWVKGLAWAALVFFLTIWAGYRFSLTPMKTEADRPHRPIEKIFGSEGTAHDAAEWLIELPIPASEFWRGVFGFLSRNKDGHLAYFFGEVRTHGWWHYYPIIIALKTPLPFLILTAIGLGVALCRIKSGTGDLRLLAPALAALCVVALGMIGSVHNGVRNVLAVYPLLALSAGLGLVWLFSWARFRLVGVGLGLVLLGWQLTASVLAHSDYLSFFNELAGDAPERIVADSDLDWGQDLKRLTATLERRGITQLAISYNGGADLKLPYFRLPEHTELVPHTKTSGWIAISVLRLRLGANRRAPYDDFAWLEEHEPVEKVGRSIRLYYIPPD